MQKWMYLRLAVNYRGENEVYSVTSNGTPISNNHEDKTKAIDLQQYVEQLGNQGWELVNVYQDSQLCEVYHFKRPIE